MKSSALKWRCCTFEWVRSKPVPTAEAVTASIERNSELKGVAAAAFTPVTPAAAAVITAETALPIMLLVVVVRSGTIKTPTSKRLDASSPIVDGSGSAEAQILSGARASKLTGRRHKIGRME